MRAKQPGIDRFTFKTLAIAAMLVDHIGWGFYPGVLWMRCVGRLTMPVMCFFVGEGIRQTHDVKRYAGRLLIFALVAEIPYQLFFHKPGNVMFTLLGGLLILWAWRDLRNKIAVAAVTALVLIAVSLPGYDTDYGSMGVMMVFLAGYLPHPAARAVAPALLCGINIMMAGADVSLWYWPLFAGFLLCFYHGKRGYSMKYLFYLFYPLHLLVLWGVRMWGMRAWGI
jgi:hypothetical protein